MSCPKEMQEACKSLLDIEMVMKSLPDNMCWLTHYVTYAIIELSSN
jgi:hypothetical protein